MFLFALGADEQSVTLQVCCRKTRATLSLASPWCGKCKVSHYKCVTRRRFSKKKPSSQECSWKNFGKIQSKYRWHRGSERSQKAILKMTQNRSQEGYPIGSEAPWKTLEHSSGALDWKVILLFFLSRQKRGTRWARGLLSPWFSKRVRCTLDCSWKTSFCLKMEPTWLQLGSNLGPKMEPRWSKNPSQNRSCAPKSDRKSISTLKA